MPRLQKVLDNEAAVAKQEEDRRVKEEKVTAIMERFEQVEISGDNAANEIEALDTEFGIDEEEVDSLVGPGESNEKDQEQMTLLCSILSLS